MTDVVATPQPPKFVHLRVHSDFSMMDGLNKTKPILARIADEGMPAVAITDQMNMCGLVRFYGTAHGLGIKPIVGADFGLKALNSMVKLPD